MDGSEKEAVQWVRDAFGEGLSRAEVIRRLQRQGLKLEYIDVLIGRAQRPKRILLGSLIFVGIVLICFLVVASYIYFYPVKMENLQNPFAGKNFSVNAEEGYDDFKITPDIVSYLLNSIGAWKLKMSPLSMKRPVIVCVVDGKVFHSIVNGGKIQTYEGDNSGADIKIITTEKVVFDSLSSEDSVGIFKDSFVSGGSSIETVANEKELFLKGYLGLYNSLAQ